MLELLIVSSKSFFIFSNIIKFNYFNDLKLFIICTCNLVDNFILLILLSIIFFRQNNYILNLINNNILKLLSKSILIFYIYKNFTVHYFYSFISDYSSNLSLFYYSFIIHIIFVYIFILMSLISFIKTFNYNIR